MSEPQRESGYVSDILMGCESCREERACPSGHRVMVARLDPSAAL